MHQRAIGTLLELRCETLLSCAALRVKYNSTNMKAYNARVAGTPLKTGDHLPNDRCRNDKAIPFSWV